MKISPPAFPTYLAENMAHGMTIRDYFAAAAMQVFLNSSSWSGHRFENAALLSYEMADAMLAERDK